MPDASFEVEGLPELVAKMEGLSYDLKRKGGRFALRKAANLIRDKAKEGAHRLDDPQTGQSIADNIAVRFAPRVFRQTGDLMFRVGVLKGAVLRNAGDTSAGSPTPHWRLLELGREGVPPTPFMRPALAENIEAASRVFVVEYGKAIDRALKRAAREASKAR